MRVSASKRQKALSLRTATSASIALGRIGSERTGDLPTDFGCPDCRGALTVKEVGKKGYLVFTCRVGHTFSAESLLVAKEEQLEQGLWSTIEVLDEIAQLYTALAEDGRAAARGEEANAMSERARRARERLAALRSLEEIAGPTLRRGPPEDHK